MESFTRSASFRFQRFTGKRIENGTENFHFGAGFINFQEFSFVAKFSEIAATTNFVRQQTTESTASIGNGFDHDWKLMDPSYVNPFDTSLDDEENSATFKATDRVGFCFVDLFQKIVSVWCCLFLRYFVMLYIFFVYIKHSTR